MRGSLVIEFGLCCPGWSGPPCPELRLGLVRIWGCGGSLHVRVLEWRESLDEARRLLRLLSVDRVLDRAISRPEPQRLGRGP